MDRARRARGRARVARLNGVVYRVARGRDEVDAALELRLRVFCDEQGVSREAELDGRDEGAVHVVGVADDGVVVATCRLLSFDDGEWRLGRMAVAPERRGEGVGRELLAAADAEAQGMGAHEVVLDAQTQAQPFYAACGYEPEGGLFISEGIEHIQMRKRFPRGAA